MNNYCRNCGEKLENNVKLCPKCNAEVFENRINVNEKEKEIEEYKKKENRYVIVVISLFALLFLSSYFSGLNNYEFISYISSLISLSAIVTLIYARITMNKSRKIKIMFNIFISLIIIYLLYVLIIFVACMGVLNHGCS